MRRRPLHPRGLSRQRDGGAVAVRATGTFGHDPALRTELSEYSPASAKALDIYGYVDRDGDGWREQPDGSPLLLEMASATSQLERRQNEHWQRCMDTVGLKMEFRVAQWLQTGMISSHDNS